MISPNPVIDGSAAATPGTLRMVSTSDSGTVGRLASTPVPTLVELRTRASVPALAEAKRLLKLALSVSPSARAPARNPTPSTTAASIPTRRRRCAHSPLNVTVNMVVVPPLLVVGAVVVRRSGLLADGLELVEDRFGGRFPQFADDPSVGQEQHAVGGRCGGGVVGHHHDRLVEGLHRPPKEAEQLGAGAGVEVSRGL